MSVAAIAERAMQQSVVGGKPSLDYKRGKCPCCSKPMLVLTSQPDAVCIDCCVESDESQLAIGTQPVLAVRSF